VNQAEYLVYHTNDRKLSFLSLSNLRFFINGFLWFDMVASVVQGGQLFTSCWGKLVINLSCFYYIEYFVTFLEPWNRVNVKITSQVKSVTKDPTTGELTVTIVSTPPEGAATTTVVENVNCLIWAIGRAPLIDIGLDKIVRPKLKYFSLLCDCSLDSYPLLW